MIALAVGKDLALLDAVVFAAVVAIVFAFGGQLGAWIGRRRERAISVQGQLHATGSVAFQVYGPPVLGLVILLVSVLMGMTILGVVVAFDVYRLLDRPLGS
ncbi:MAG: hypothetical protein ACC662_03015, partial [Planctomycetota bacterium]